MEQVITSWWITEEQLQATGGVVAFGNKCPDFDGFHTRMGSSCTAPPLLTTRGPPSPQRKLLCERLELLCLKEK